MVWFCFCGGVFVVGKICVETTTFLFALFPTDVLGA